MSAVTAHATATHAVVVYAVANSEIKIFKTIQQVKKACGCKKGVNDVFHFFIGLYFPETFSGQELAPFLPIGEGC